MEVQWLYIPQINQYLSQNIFVFIFKLGLVFFLLPFSCIRCGIRGESGSCSEIFSSSSLSTPCDNGTFSNKRQRSKHVIKFPPSTLKWRILYLLPCPLSLWDTKRTTPGRAGWNFGTIRKSPVAKSMPFKLCVGHQELPVPPCFLGSLSSSFLPATNPEKGAASGLLCRAPHPTRSWYWYCVFISTQDKSYRLAPWEPSLRQLCGIEVHYVCWLHSLLQALFPD